MSWIFLIKIVIGYIDGRDLGLLHLVVMVGLMGSMINGHGGGAWVCSGGASLMLMVCGYVVVVVVVVAHCSW